MSKSWTHALKLEAPVTVLEQTCYSGRAHRAESFSRFAFLERKKKKRMVLCIPATSASSERNFGAAGDIMNERRTRLKPDLLEPDSSSTRK